jgi:hypothetical protein
MILATLCNKKLGPQIDRVYFEYIFRQAIKKVYNY